MLLLRKALYRVLLAVGEGVALAGTEGVMEAVQLGVLLVLWPPRARLGVPVGVPVATALIDGLMEMVLVLVRVPVGAYHPNPTGGSTTPLITAQPSEGVRYTLFIAFVRVTTRYTVVRVAPYITNPTLPVLAQLLTGLPAEFSYLPVTLYTAALLSMLSSSPLALIHRVGGRAESRPGTGRGQ